MKKFNPKSEHAARALQTWQILIGKAMNRQTVTYEGLSELIFEKPAAGVLAGILGHVAFYCEDSKIPPLTAIVVLKGPGKPGSGFHVDAARIDEEREKVYQFDWYDVYPPSEADFSTAYQKLHK